MEHDDNNTLELLAALHSFCSTITKDEFIDKIGLHTTWDKMTNNDTSYPDIYTLLSYADNPTKRNFMEWLHDRIDHLKSCGFLGGNGND